MKVLLAGPISSGNNMGNSPIFSGLVLVVGLYVLVSVWRSYLKHRSAGTVPLMTLIFISGIAGLAILQALQTFLP